MRRRRNLLDDKRLGTETQTAPTQTLELRSKLQQSSTSMKSLLIAPSVFDSRHEVAAGRAPRAVVPPADWESLHFV